EDVYLVHVLHEGFVRVLPVHVIEETLRTLCGERRRRRRGCRDAEGDENGTVAANGHGAGFETCRDEKRRASSRYRPIGREGWPHPARGAVARQPLAELLWRTFADVLRRGAFVAAFAAFAAFAVFATSIGTTSGAASSLPQPFDGATFGCLYTKRRPS